MAVKQPGDVTRIVSGCTEEEVRVGDMTQEDCANELSNLGSLRSPLRSPLPPTAFADAEMARRLYLSDVSPLPRPLHSSLRLH